MAGENLICWTIADDRAGNRSQCRGLSEAVAALHPGMTVTHLEAELPVPWRWLPGHRVPRFVTRRILQRLTSGEAEEGNSDKCPDLLITAGRRSAAFSICLSQANNSNGSRQCKTVHIMRPGAPLRLFDRIVAPLHDQLRGDNVITMTGALNPITPALLAASRIEELANMLPESLPRPLIAVLIGGNSKYFRFTESAAGKLADDLTRLSNAGYGLAITASRRTPPEAEASLRAGLSPLIEEGKAVFWDGNGANPYIQYLAEADHIVATCDSISMLSEACATGKPVHILPLDGGSAKFTRFHNSLVESEAANWLDLEGLLAGGLPITGSIALRETARVAELVSQLLRP